MEVVFVNIIENDQNAKIVVEEVYVNIIVFVHFVKNVMVEVYVNIKKNVQNAKNVMVVAYANIIIIVVVVETVVEEVYVNMIKYVEYVLYAIRQLPVIIASNHLS